MQGRIWRRITVVVRKRELFLYKLAFVSYGTLRREVSVFLRLFEVYKFLLVAFLLQNQTPNNVGIIKFQNATFNYYYLVADCHIISNLGSVIFHCTCCFTQENNQRHCYISSTLVLCLFIIIATTRTITLSCLSNYFIFHRNLFSSCCMQSPSLSYCAAYLILQLLPYLVCRINLNVYRNLFSSCYFMYIYCVTYGGREQGL